MGNASKKEREQVPDLLTPFDQTFKDYSFEHATPIVEAFQKKYTNGLFIQRSVNITSVQQSVQVEQKIPPKDGISRLLQIIGGNRTYFTYLPQRKYFKDPKDSFSTFFGIQPTQFSSSASPDDDSALNRLPLVLLLHGTDETAFDTELLKQMDEKMSWLELSDSEDVVLLFAQSRGHWTNLKNSWRDANDFLRTLWLPKYIDKTAQDHQYLNAVHRDICKICPAIDASRIYVVGFSNGGFMACDVTLDVGLMTGNSEKILEFDVRASCLYMGGIAEQQMERTASLSEAELPDMELVIIPPHGQEGQPKTVGSIFKKKKKEEEDSTKTTTDEVKRKEDKLVDKGTQSGRNLPDVMIVTGTLDEQLFSCHKAWQCVTALNFRHVKLHCMEGSTHKFLSESTPIIWSFFRHSPHNVAPEM